jgi:hypothetical protein
MAKFNYEHVAAGAGFSGEQFEICAAGAEDTGILDVQLSAGSGALTDDAPHVLVSTGAVGAAAGLDISGMELESADKGGQALPGRFFFLSIQNTDIATNNITVTSSATINGSASLVIKSTGDYLFHHVASGVWRANQLPRPEEPLATLARIPFASTKWDAGAVKNTIVVKASGAIALNQIGPHNLQPYSSYVVQVINTDATPDEMVDVEVQFDASGDITLKKASKGADFAGVVVIVGSLD